MNWPQIKKKKKNHHFEVLPSPILCNNNESFFDRIAMCDKSRFYMITSDDHLSGWTKKKLQSTSESQTWTKRRSQSLSGGLLPSWSATAFWMSAKALHKSTLSKSMRCTKNCNACSQHGWTEWAQFFPMTMPDDRSHNPHFKSWMNLTTKFCLVCHIHLTSHQLTTTSSSVSTSPFAGKTLSQPAGGKKCQGLSNPKAWVLMLQGQTNLFLIGKKMRWL